MNPTTDVTTVRSADGTPIAFDRSGEGPPVVIVGAASNDRGFGPLVDLADRLAPRFTAYNYDRRGRGDSGDNPPYAVAREVEDLNAIIREAGGAAAVYGLSSGAVLAVEAAAAGAPITRLALFEPPLPLGQDLGEAAFRDRLAELIGADHRDDAIEMFMSGVGLPPEAIAGMRETPAWAGMVALAPTFVYDATITADRSLWSERAPTVHVPTIVLTSAGSPEYLRESARVAAETIPTAELRTLEGTFHEVPVDALAGEVAGFFHDRDQPQR